MSAAWKVDDFNSDLHRLSDLISVICELQFDLPAGEYDARVDGLLWIAREMSAGLKDHHDQNGQVAQEGGAK